MDSLGHRGETRSTMALPISGDPLPDSQQSLQLYLTETAPAPVEKRSLARWSWLVALAVLLHLVAFQLLPRLFTPPPPPPIEVQQIDASKLAAIKNSWKERGFLVAKDPAKPNTNEAAPKNARYESDRNQTVEKEMQGSKTNVVPNQSGDPAGAGDKDGAKKHADSSRPSQVKKIPLSNLSNFQGLPIPGPRPDESGAARRGRPGETADQNLADPNLPVGAETMLNTVESVYYSFYSRLYEQIGPLWQSRVRAISGSVGPGEYITIAEIVFDADGNYVETNIQRSSGVPALDGAIHASWRQIPRFPNPPRDLVQRDGKIHMVWTFNFLVDGSRQWQYVPPERQY